MSAIRTWDEPGPDDIGASAREFLKRLGGPTWLTLRGHDQARTRAFTTLLHGNEPSGIRALHGWLRAGERPAVNLVCFIGAVDAALSPPGFVHRMLPGKRDLNRCFRPPYAEPEERVACELLERLRECGPEALVDLHNTSGEGPAYGVTTRVDPARLVMTSFFSDLLIRTDLRLGALVEATEADFPSVVVECGGATDPRSDEIAVEGFRRFARADSLLPNPSPPQVTVYEDPLRVVLRDDASIVYGCAAEPGADVTLFNDLDHRNHGMIPAGELLGWVGPRGLAALAAWDSLGRDRADEFLAVQDGKLLATRPFRPFMITTDATIARADCLFYAIEAQVGA